MKRLLLILISALISVIAWAHDPQLSGIGVLIGNDSAVIAVQVHLNKVHNASELTERLALTINGQPFVATTPQIITDKQNGVIYWRSTYRGSVKDFSVAHRLFPEDDSSRTIVSVTKNGAEISETILDASHPSTTSTNAAQQPSVINVIGQFVKLGILHIFTGPDHILIILGLILLGGTLKTLLKTVTAFTVAHSITLTVAATGLWTPASKYIEPIIALSIVAVAFENLRKKENKKDWRPLIAFVFGLIHGFGFAGGLTEVGLPHGAMAWALASFNVGVECAQMSIVLVAAPALAMLAKSRPTFSYRFVAASSLAIAVAGAIWFAERIKPL